jgi:hypothetical protein
LLASGPLPQGRHRAFRSAIVGLAPRVLPLTPQVAFFISFGRPRFRSLPLLGSYHVSVVTTGFPVPPSRIAQSATVRIPFPLPVATPEGCSGFISVRPEPLDGGPPHWLTVATVGFYRLCSPHAPKPRTEGRDSASRPVFPTRTTCLIALRADAAHRLVSWSFDAGRNDPP